MTKKIFLLSSLLCSNFLFSGVISEQFQKQYSEDVNTYLSDDKFIKAENILSSKVSFKLTGTPAKKPNYLKAFNLFIDSAKNGNPISAFGAVYIADSYFPNTRKILSKRKDAIKILYEFSPRNCTSGLYYGDMLLKGQGVKVNKGVALKIYKNIDTETCSDWRKNVVFSRIEFSGKQ